MIIRWSRLIPRLLLLAALLLAVGYFRDDLARWRTCALIESQTGVAARLDAVRSDWKTKTVVFDDLRLVDPDAPQRELLRVEKITVRGSAEDILSRFLRFPEITLEGIKVVVDGADSEQLIPDELWLKFKDRIPPEARRLAGLDWTSMLSGDPEDAAQTLLRQFETGMLAAEIAERWPKEAAKFERSAASIKDRFRDIRERADRAARPEDKILLLNEMLKELEGADTVLRQLFDGIASLKSTAQTDYQSLVTASRRDQASLKTLQPPKLDADLISETLIGPETREQWKKTVAWSDWARSLLVPGETADGAASVYERFGLKPPKRFSGETIHLASLDARPNLLVDSLDMTGQILFGSLPVYFNGRIRNIAHSMTLSPEPMLAQFCFSGSGIPSTPILPDGEAVVAAQVPAVMDPSIVPNIYITLRMDRIGVKEDDQLIVRCPMYQLPQRILGDAEKFAISVSPGVSALDGVLLAHGDRLSGEIRMTQAGVRLALLLPEKQRQNTVFQLLQQSLDSLDGFTAKIFVNGTRTELVYAFHSDIADRIAPQIETLLRAEWESVCRDAEKKIIEEANRAVTALNAVIRDRLDPIVNELGSQRDLWERQIAQGTGLPLDQLVQGALSDLPAKDRQRLDQFLGKPAVQALIGSNPGTGQPDSTTIPSPERIDQSIQQGVDKLQEKLPGLLDRWRNR